MERMLVDRSYYDIFDEQVSKVPETRQLKQEQKDPAILPDAISPFVQDIEEHQQ